jgi:hypothetical protein
MGNLKGLKGKRAFLLFTNITTNNQMKQLIIQRIKQFLKEF